LARVAGRLDRAVAGQRRALDRDYERIAAVTAQEHVWFVPDGALAEVKV
jgi:hypothetical protein